jgi:hypothetical protein
MAAGAEAALPPEEKSLCGGVSAFVLKADRQLTVTAAVCHWWLGIVANKLSHISIKPCNHVGHALDVDYSH